jgi:hypothetical protein
MMVLTEVERKKNRGDALREMKKNMTKAQVIHRNFAAGRPPASELRTPAEVIGLAKILLRELQSAMRGAKLEPEDCGVRIAFMSTDLSMIYTRKLVLGDAEKRLRDDLTTQPVIMVGFFFGIVDRKADPDGNHVLVGVKPLLQTKNVLEAIKERLETPWVGMN